MLFRGQNNEHRRLLFTEQHWKKYCTVCPETGLEQTLLINAYLPDLTAALTHDASSCKTYGNKQTHSMKTLCYTYTVRSTDWDRKSVRGERERELYTQF